MRQVDLDELTYHIFSGLRAWTPSLRARLFAPLAKRRDSDLQIAAEALASRMSRWEIVDPATPDIPVETSEVAAAFVAAIRALPGAIPSLWATRVREREREAQAATASLLAQSLDRFEIFTETALDPHGVRVVWFRTPQAPTYAYAARWP